MTSFSAVLLEPLHAQGMEVSIGQNVKEIIYPYPASHDLLSAGLTSLCSKVAYIASSVTPSCPRLYFFCGSFVLCLSCFCPSCCLKVTCWERAVIFVLVCHVKLWFCHFPAWYPRSGLVLDCIDS